MARPTLSRSELDHLRATWIQTHGSFMDAVDAALAAKDAAQTFDVVLVVQASDLQEADDIGERAADFLGAGDVLVVGRQTHTHEGDDE